MSGKESHILLFDGVCNLCNSMVQFTIKRDRQRKLKFTSLQSERGQALLKSFGLPTNDFHSFVFISGEKYFLRSSAALRVLKELGGVWKAFYLFIVLPRPVRDFVYDLIAKNRYNLFGRRNTCMIPTTELKDRFLE